MVMSKQAWAEEAKAALDAKAKPPGSLGLLEEWAVRLCALQETLRPSGGPVATLIFAADHGVTKTHPVSAYPRQVTQSIFKAIAKGQAASSVLSAANGTRLVLVDVGVDGDVTCVNGDGSEVIDVRHSKVAFGTNDFTNEPAMSPEQLDAAMEAGRAAVNSLHGDGILAICLGELGIGNTTSAAALLAALSGNAVSEVTGRGTGLDEDGLAKKVTVIEAALARAGRPEAHADARQMLMEVGGLELAAMVGATLQATSKGMAVLVDGFICGAAALVATRMDESAQGALFCCHKSAEAGGGALLQALGQPCAAMDLRLRLGEASGAIVAAPLLRSAAALMTMATLQEALE